MKVAALLLIALAALPRAGEPRRDGEPGDVEYERVVALLLGVVEEDASASSGGSDLGARLDSLAATHAPALFEILGSGGIPSAWVPAGHGPLDHEPLDHEKGESLLPLGPGPLRAIRDALCRLPRATLRAFLAHVAANEPRVRFREQGVDVLGESCTAGDLRLLTALASPLFPGNDVLARFLRNTFEAALLRALNRDEDTFVALLDQFDEIHIGLQSTAIDALRHHQSGRALQTLAGLLRRSPTMDAHLLTTMARLGENVPHPIHPEVRARVRSFLSDSDDLLVRGAVRACGLLEDYEAIPALLDLYESDDRELGETAHRTLRQLTGIPLHYEQGAWRRWYERELAWWNEERPGLVADVRNGGTEEACLAIAALSRRRLNRHVLAEAVLEGLSRREPRVRIVACQALAGLGSDFAVEKLVGELTHPAEEVRNAAWQALVAITGLHIPLDAELWRSST